MKETQILLPSFDMTPVEKLGELRDAVGGMSLKEIVERAIDLLRSNEPDGGYNLQFSGGKDSIACKKCGPIRKSNHWTSDLF